MNNSIITVNSLSHRYATQWAIKDISFEIPRSGVYGLLGANGAGKSTTMNIMSGVLKQTKGDVVINGVDLAKDPMEAKRFIGFLPQTPPLYLDMTVEEYLHNCAHLRRIRPADIRKDVDGVMERCGLTHMRRRLLNNLSGGYRQRVGLAQAIVHAPALVILDEPTNGLDPNQILEIRKLIEEIAQEHAVLFSTHILSEAHAICDHILMIDEGSLVFFGETSEFDAYLQPNSVFVRLLAKPAEDTLKDSLEGIVRIEVLGGGDYRIVFDQLDGAIRRLVAASVMHEWDLDEVRTERHSMGDVFSALSKKRGN